MGNRRNALACALGAVSAALTMCHLANRWIFGQVSGESRVNSIWRCDDYGDVAFAQIGEGNRENGAASADGLAEDAEAGLPGRPILLVHGIGIGAGSSDWDENMDALSKNRTVYALDLPGFGNSSKDSMTYNSYFYARVINDFIRKIIGRKTDVIVMNVSCGFVLAGAAMEKELYGRIIAINPYDEGVSMRTLESSFVRRMLPLPIVGTAVYNFCASRQSILGFLDGSAPVTESYEDVRNLMEKQYENAHKYGVNNKYGLICYLQGMLKTSIFSLMNSCPAKLLVVVSTGSVMPLLEERENVRLAEIKGGEFYPNIYAKERFMEIAEDFFEILQEREERKEKREKRKEKGEAND